MGRHLLVTNDFPPKVGGIQSYLWELWRRLPSDDVVVHTTPYEGTEAFDAAQAFTVIRSPEPWLLPQPVLVARVNRLIAEHDVDLVLLDPAVPVGLIGPHLDVPYGVVLPGAEVTIPGRVPVSRQLLNPYAQVRAPLPPVQVHQPISLEQHRRLWGDASMQLVPAPKISPDS